MKRARAAGPPCSSSATLNVSPRVAKNRRLINLDAPAGGGGGDGAGLMGRGAGQGSEPQHIPNMPGIRNVAALTSAVGEQQQRGSELWVLQQPNYHGYLHRVQGQAPMPQPVPHVPPVPHVGALHAESPQTLQMVQHLHPARQGPLPFHQAYLNYVPPALSALPAPAPQQQIVPVGGQPPPGDHASVPNAWPNASAASRDEELHNRRLNDTVLQPWSQQELESLAVLVCQDGPGNWSEKALLLGTGRTAASTGSAWRRYERQVKDGTREPLPNMPPIGTPCPTARMGSTVGYKSSAAPGAESSDTGELTRYSLCREAHERLRGVWPTPAFVQLTFDAPGPMGISWCCREITPASTDDKSLPKPEKKQQQAQDREQRYSEERENTQKADSVNMGGVKPNQDTGADMDEVLRRHLPPRPWSVVHKAGNVDDCSGKCVALIESVEPGSAADAFVSTLPSTERALLLREGIDVCLEAINGQSVHSNQHSYTTTLRSLRLTRRPLTILVRTHAIGTEPTLLGKLSELPISTLQKLQLQSDGDVRTAAMLDKSSISGSSTDESAELRDEKEEEAKTKAKAKAKAAQHDSDHEGQEQQNVQECGEENDLDQILRGHTNRTECLHDLCSGEITTDDEGYMSDTDSVADSIDCSPSSPSPTPSISLHEEMLLLESMKQAAPSLFCALPPVIVSDWIGKSWPAEWEACIQDPYEADADGDNVCDKMTDEEDGKEQEAEEGAQVAAAIAVAAGSVR